LRQLSHSAYIHISPAQTPGEHERADTPPMFAASPPALHRAASLGSCGSQSLRLPAPEHEALQSLLSRTSLTASLANDVPTVDQASNSSTATPQTRRPAAAHAAARLLRPPPLQVVGNTPLIRLQRLGASINPTNKIYIKLEGSNPGGSAKDRPALHMLDAAERSGRLCPGGRVIECTTGDLPARLPAHTVALLERRCCCLVAAA